MSAGVTLDGRAIAVGAAAALIVALPVGAIGAALLDEGNDLVLAFGLLALAGCGLGGFVAASKRPDAPLSHGTVAALAAYLVAQAVIVLINVAAGDDVDPSAIAATAVLAGTAGMAGGLVADRRSARA